MREKAMMKSLGQQQQNVLRETKVATEDFATPSPPTSFSLSSSSNSFPEVESVTNLGASSTTSGEMSLEQVKEEKTEEPVGNSLKRSASSLSESGGTGRSVRAKVMRPKVIPEKGQRQCLGYNRKKKCRCGNAALMEFFGPPPDYCAEHIHLDTESLYCKCRATRNITKSGSSAVTNRGCREVVLKQFGFCHKHFNNLTQFLVGPSGIEYGQLKLQRVNELLMLLEKEALQAKQIDGDMFQRKTKIIPKFKELRSVILLRIEELQRQQQLQPFHPHPPSAL